MKVLYHRTSAEKTRGIVASGFLPEDYILLSDLPLPERAWVKGETLLAVELDICRAPRP